MVQAAIVSDLDEIPFFIQSDAKVLFSFYLDGLPKGN